MKSLHDLIAEYRLKNTPSCILVFIDGKFEVTLSDLALLPKNVIAQDLKTARVEHQNLLKPYLENSAVKNKAAREGCEGLFLHIPDEIVLQMPVHLLHLNTGANKNPKSEAHHLQHIIVVGAASKASIIEEYASIKKSTSIDELYSNNVAVQIHLKEKADLQYCKIQNEALTAKHAADLNLSLEESSQITTCHLLTGGAKAKENIRTIMLAPHATCYNFGLYVLHEKQKLELATNIKHVAINCRTRELFKGVIHDQSRAEFNGKISIDASAQQSVARLDNNNLLLHEQARVITSPALEIYADDVTCSHGATVGQLDDDALWYLQARGIERSAAESILIQGFMQEVIALLPAFLQTKISNLLASQA